VSAKTAALIDPIRPLAALRAFPSGGSAPARRPRRMPCRRLNAAS